MTQKRYFGKLHVKSNMTKSNLIWSLPLQIICPAPAFNGSVSLTLAWHKWQYVSPCCLNDFLPVTSCGDTILSSIWGNHASSIKISFSGRTCNKWGKKKAKWKRSIPTMSIYQRHQLATKVWFLFKDWTWWCVRQGLSHPGHWWLIYLNTSSLSATCQQYDLCCN